MTSLEISDSFATHPGLSATVGLALKTNPPPELDPASDLAAQLAHHGMGVLRGAGTDDAALMKTVNILGTPMFTDGERAVPGFAALNIVTNAARATPPRSRFHTDSSYFRRPPSHTALRAVALPRCGGATLLLDMYAAFETLDSALKRRLTGRRMRHVVTGVTPGKGAETQSWQPIFRRHPISGRTALYVTVPERCVEIEGIDDAAPIVSELYTHATAQRVIRHDWQVGDLLIWDNRCTLHKGDHSEVKGERTLHRGMAQGEVPEMAA